jgi:hypothetical protein
VIRAGFVIVAVAVVALFTAAGGSAGSSPPDVTCSQVTQSFSGTAHDLTVPVGGYCAVNNATITHDLVVQRNGGSDVNDSTIGYDALYAKDAFGDITGSTVLHDALYAGEGCGNVIGSTIGYDLGYDTAGGCVISDSTIGHDVTSGFNSDLFVGAVKIGHNFVASEPNSVQVGGNDPTVDSHVQVGNDFVINGSPGPPDPNAFLFDGICDLSVGNDLSITNRWVTLGIGLGEHTCGGTPSGPVTVGRDLIYTGNTGLTNPFFGPTGLGFSGVTVGRNITVTGNSATGDITLADNTIGGNATCRNNNPPASLAGGGPNSIGGINRGCP